MKYTVSDCVERYNGRMLYIGALKGFLWIGKGEDATFALKCLDKKHKELKLKSYENKIRELDRLIRAKEIELEALKYIEANNKRKLKAQKETIARINDKIVCAQDFIKRTDYYIKHWTPMIRRNVSEIYVRNCQSNEPLGIAIIMEGDEGGNYWTYKEFTENPRAWL